MVLIKEIDQIKYVFWRDRFDDLRAKKKVINVQNYNVWKGPIEQNSSNHRIYT